LELVRGVVCGTTTYFNYDPREDEIKSLYGRVRKVAVQSLDNVALPPADVQEMRARLKAAEAKMLFVHRRCQGDASETGLV
jgi:cytochrome c